MNWIKDLFSSPKPDNTAFIITGDGNITLTRNAKTHSIGKTHPHYAAIVSALSSGKFAKLDGLLDAAAKINREFNGRVAVNEFGEVFHNGVQLHNSLAKRIGEFARSNMPYKPLLKFLENLMENPSQRAINELYTFLDHAGLPITADGHFVAYKGLRSDFKDVHSGQFDNSIGAIHEMPRNAVNDNAEITCSYGFHVGTHEYASGFAQGKLVLVKVNPRDAVSVPLDHDAQKLRVCRYEVIAMCEKLIQEPMYRSSNGDLSDNTADAFMDGYRCFENGGRGIDNPYMDDEENMELYNAWDAGFEDAAEDAGEADDYDDEEEDIEEVEEATGRRRGQGGKFLPS